MSAVVLLLAIVVGVLALLVIGLLRSHAEILRAMHDAGISLDPDREHDHTGAVGTTRTLSRPQRIDRDESTMI